MISHARAATIRAPRWVLAACGIVVTLALVACSSGGTGSSPTGTAPTESAPPAATPGLEWTLVDAPGPLPDGVSVSTFGAAGRLWTYDPEVPTMLYSTVDAVEWLPLDLTASGLPADARLAHGIGGRDVVDDRGDAATIVYTTSTNGTHPAGLNEQLWLVDLAGDGEQAVVEPGAELGLENLPAPDGALTFRTETIVDFAVLGDSRIVLGAGQWWEPFKTGRSDAFTAVEADGQWEVHSAQADAPLGADAYDAAPLALEVLGDRLVMLSQPAGNLYPFDAWVSTDGRQWESGAAVFEGAGAAYRLRAVGGDGERLVAVGYEGEFTSGVPVAWSTTDGVTWTRAALPGIDEAEPFLVAHGGSGYVVLGKGVDAVAWTSPDGVSWELADLDIPFAAVDSVKVGTGLVAHYGTGTRVSGLDWAAAE